MNEAVAKRGRGRPKGSKNKSRIISGATVEDYCKLHNHNPTEFLIRVARGENLPFFEPGPDDIMRANVKLHDSIHHNKAIGSVGQDGAVVDGQYTIVFEESPVDLPLPGAANAGTVAPIVPEQSIQRTGDSPPSG